MSAQNYAKTAGTWSGVGIVLAEAVGFHPLGMLLGAGIAVGSRFLGAGGRAREGKLR